MTTLDGMALRLASASRKTCLIESPSADRNPQHKQPAAVCFTSDPATSFSAEHVEGSGGQSPGIASSKMKIAPLKTRG